MLTDNKAILFLTFDLIYTILTLKQNILLCFWKCLKKKTNIRLVNGINYNILYHIVVLYKEHFKVYDKNVSIKSKQ